MQIGEWKRYEELIRHSCQNNFFMFIYTCCFTDSTKRFLKELHSAMEA